MAAVHHARGLDSRPKADHPILGRVLSAFITAKMDLRWSPQQISHELAVAYPDREELRMSA